MSLTLIFSLRLAASRYGKPLLCVGGAAIAAIAAPEAWMPAESAGGHMGVLRGCVSEVLALQSRLNFPSSSGTRTGEGGPCSPTGKRMQTDYG